MKSIDYLLELIDIFHSANEMLNGDIVITAAKKTYWRRWYEANKEKFNALVNKHKRSRRKEFKTLIDEKKNAPCQVCGNNYPPEAMDLCHKDDVEKLFRISDAGRKIYNIDKLKIELDKCDVYCGNCRKIKELQDIVKTDDKKNNLRKIVDEMKAVNCCNCGQSYPSYVMEFHHLDGDTKSGTIALMMNNNKKQDVLDEIAKAVVLCINCHRTETKRQKDNKLL